MRSEAAEEIILSKFLKFLCTILYYWLAFQIMGCIPECNSGDVKCKNNKLYRCVGVNNATYTSGIGDRYETHLDCSDYGAVCEQGVDGYSRVGPNSALYPQENIACVVPDSEYTCDEGQTQGCFGKTIVQCDSVQQKVIIQDIMDYNNSEYKLHIQGPNYLYCVENEDLGTAHFAYSEDPCIEGESKCIADDAMLTCESGYWTVWDPCLTASSFQCIETDAGVAACQLQETDTP